MRKTDLVRKLLPATSLLWLLPLVAHAACSSNVGKVVFNELYKPASGSGSFIEIKVLDPSVVSSTSNFQNWKIDLYAGNHSTMQQTDVSSGFASSSVNACGQTSLWVRFPSSVLTYLSSMPADYNLVLYDSSSGKQIVDIMRLGTTATSYYGAGTSYQSCDQIESQLPASGSSPSQYDAIVSTSGASEKDWYRQPDGTGPWLGTSTSGTYNTACGSNSGGAGTYGVAKAPAVTDVMPNTNFSYMLYSINGSTAVTSPSSVVITDDLGAAGLNFVSCTTAQGTCSYAGGIVTWTVGAVAANTSYTATLTVQAPTTGTVVNSISTNVTGVSATAAAVNVINPLVEYRMEEASWSGTAGEVKDNLNVYNATAASLSTIKPTTDNTSPAIAGSPGTCRYGVFNRSHKDYLALPSTFPNLGSQSFTITGWIRTTNNALSAQRIFEDDEHNTGGYGFSLGDGGAGRLRFFSRGTPSALSLDTPNVISSNTWYFVAAVADVPNKVKYIYVFSASGTLLSSVSASWTEASFGSDSGIASIGGETNAATENTSAYGFSGNIDEVRVYQGAFDAAALDLVRRSTHVCAGAAAVPARFNCIESGAAADTGHLYTKLAGLPFSFDVAALKSDGTVETGYVGSTDKNVTVELGYATDTSCTGWTAVSPAVSQTLTFTAADQGRKAAASMTVSNAYPNLRCRVTDANQTPSVVACSADNFSVRPSGLTVASTDATADGTGSSATATPAIKAGNNFNLTATAIAGYNGTPRIDATRVAAKAGTSGTVTDNFGAANVITGVASSTSTYTEVGYFNLAAYGVYDDTFTAVDSANGDCTGDFSNTLVGGKYGCKFGNAAASNYFGRFVPDHFDTAVIYSGGVPMNCPAGLSCPTSYNGMVYSAQPFSVQVTAKNAAGSTTANYSSATGLSKAVALAAWDAPGSTTTQNPGGNSTSLSNGSVAASAFVSGIGSSALPSYAFASSPTLPTAIYLRAGDSDGVTSLRAAPSSSVEGGVEIVSGRIKLSNAYGSELLPLPITATAQYYKDASSGWVTSSTDSASQFSSKLSSAGGNVQPSIVQGPLMLANVSVIAPGTLTLSGGVRSFSLAAPGTGHSGSVDLSIVTSPAWLLPGISGRATFGVYRGSNDFIYQREVY